MQAWIQPATTPPPHYRAPSIDDLLSMLEASNVMVDEFAARRLEQYVELAARQSDSVEGEEPSGMYLVAQGTAPVEPEDGTFEWSSAMTAKEQVESEDGSIDYFAQTHITTIEAGVTVGHITPPTEGRPGRDVLGRPVKPKRRRGLEIQLERGLVLAEDGRGVVTETAGRVVREANKLRVENVLDLGTDVNFATGSIDVCVDVCVRGVVSSGFHVRTTKSLEVGRAIEAATVDAADDVHVHGGICGRGDLSEGNRATVRSGGCLSARFCNDALVSAVGEIRVEKEILNSHVRTMADLMIEHGTIIGGFVWAREGVEAAVLGSAAGVMTYVCAGVPQDVVRRAQQMQKESKARVESAKQIRGRLRPLVANLKRLTPRQREKATEMLSSARDLEAAARAIEAQRTRMLDAARPKKTPRIRVNRVIRPGVRIVLGAREVLIDSQISGPVSIEEKSVRGATEVVCVHQRMGSVRLLVSSDVDWDALPVVESSSAGGKDGKL